MNTWELAIEDGRRLHNELKAIIATKMNFEYERKLLPQEKAEIKEYCQQIENLGTVAMRDEKGAKEWLRHIGYDYKETKTRASMVLKDII